jgi:hypothetical protein
MTNGERKYPDRHLPRITLDGLPQRRSNMLDWIVTAGGVGLFAVLLFFWVRWTEMERELFANGNARHLE